MTDFEYIFKQAKTFHNKVWDTDELRKCVDMLENLTREELIILYKCRWVPVEGVLHREIFNVLFKDKIGKREERVKNLETNALIAEFQDKKAGNVALCRAEMKSRYLEGRDMEEIAEAFNASTNSDQQWVKRQIEKKEKDEHE